MSNRMCRWGVLGTANIVRKNWPAIWHSGNGELVAVASRDRSRSQAFIDACQTHVPFATPPQAIGDYESLLARDDIDAVYVPLPTRVRKEWVIRAAEMGKHVLCEKPCAVTAADLSEMLAACRQNNVQFMDGVMFMHSHRLPKMGEVLAEGSQIGDVKRITSHFGYCAPPEWFTTNIRSASELEPLGCLGDVGWYCLLITLWSVSWQLPREVVGRALQVSHRPGSPHPVPIEFSGEMFFDDGVSAAFYCSFVTHDEQWLRVSGTRGHLFVPNFVVPAYGCQSFFEVQQDRLTIAGCHFNRESRQWRHAVDEYSSGARNSQETEMFRAFSAGVLSGTLEPFWGEVSLRTQQLLDACLASSHAGSRPVAVPAAPAL